MLLTLAMVEVKSGSRVLVPSEKYTFPPDLVVEDATAH